jgi:FKBP-type peptidyl-prolyl cis-trans isomerase FklB
MSLDEVVARLAEGPETASLKLARWPEGREMTNARDRAWLEANSREEGVVTLASGLQYRAIKNGTGPGNIKMDTPCECHYAGTLIDGTEFDSSYKRGKPITFAPKQVIKAWTEAMRLMREGDVWELFCPSELAYGARGSGRFIKPGDALVFTISIERKL